MTEIEICSTEAQIRACFPVMRELRPAFDERQFCEVVQRMSSTQGYLLVALRDEGAVRAALGMRSGESLAWGRYIYVDDLVTTEKSRSRGYGKLLLDWAAEYGKREGCAELHLDSGVQRFGAHRFYLRERMDIVFHHFRRSLAE
ncbi:MAG TPA: GNAT family N-acetyltransferase [Polyangiaceae bacterium]|nr:GNAT family N-acetyltransferase [Polyangiaceae bacterium]